MRAFGILIPLVTIGLAGSLISIAGCSLGQDKSPPKPDAATFVGCPSEGWAGHIAAPTAAPPRSIGTRPLPPGLVLYASETQSVLGPAGWFCYGISSSAESTLFVTPDKEGMRRAQEFGASRAFSTDSGLTIRGPVIQASVYSGIGPGGWVVARAVERAFPVAEARARSWLELHGLSHYARLDDPDPQDRFVRRSDTWVEYTSGLAGLGGVTYILPSDPIDGAAILDLRGGMALHKIDVLLPIAFEELKRFIIADFETTVFAELKKDGGRPSRHILQNLCPLEISTDESLPEPVEGWQANVAAVPAKLNQIDVNLAPPDFASGAGRHQPPWWGFREAETLLRREDT